MDSISWLVGGPQGSGVETASTVFSRMCTKAGYQIFGKREFHSNIKGEHSYFEIRVSDKTVRSNRSAVNLMVSYDAETIFRHYASLAPGGAIIYDVDIAYVETSGVATLDPYFRERLDGEIRRLGSPPHSGGRAGGGRPQWRAHLSRIL